MIHLYGIPNCDTMKKARRWLADHGVEYQFHDYKKEGIAEARLRAWMEQVGWQTLLNRRGMMWRKLSQAQRDNIDQASALTIMLEAPSIIKRPVLEHAGGVLVGFDEAQYKELFDS